MAKVQVHCQSSLMVKCLNGGTPSSDTNNLTGCADQASTLLRQHPNILYFWIPLKHHSRPFRSRLGLAVQESSGPFYPGFRKSSVIAVSVRLSSLASPLPLFAVYSFAVGRRIWATFWCTFGRHTKVRKKLNMRLKSVLVDLLFQDKTFLSSNSHLFVGQSRTLTFRSLGPARSPHQRTIGQLDDWAKGEFAK